MKLFIIIVSFNNGEDVTRLVESLGKEKVSRWEMEIVVVENGENQKVNSQQSTFNIKIIKNQKNLGFAKGANIGIKYALKNSADRILLLNPDTVIESGIIQTLIANKSDIISPVIKFQRKGRWIYDYGGRIDWRWGRTRHVESTISPVSFRGIAEKSSKTLPSVARSLASFGKTKIDYVSGCCMLVKREVFDTTGLFDERFFLYFEDVDFCIRAKKAGFKVVVEPKASIIHNLTEGVQKPFSSQLELIKSNVKFIYKYLGITKPLGFLYCLILTGKLCINRLFQQSF